MGSICGVLLDKVSQKTAKKSGIYLLLSSVGIYAFELCRINIKIINDVYQRLFGSLMRESERN